MQYYIEIAQARTNNRNFIIRADHLKNYLTKARQRQEELYQSYYYYDEEIIEHMKIRKTVKNFRGNFHLPHIIFDIDKGTNTDDLTLTRAKVFIEKLNDDWNVDPENIRIWFSGRGYHITIDNIFRFEASNYLPDEWKATAQKYFPEVDTAPYMSTGLIRVGYSINEKVGRYKIPISIEELYSLDAEAIIKLAHNHEYRIFKSPDIKSDLNYSDLIVHTQQAAQKREKIVATVEPNNIVTCMQKLYNRGPVEGRRHDDMLRMISAFARKGVPLRGTISMMKDWVDGGMEPYEVEKNVKDVYNPERQYKYSCQDPIMKEFCSPKCIHFANKDYEPEKISAKDAEKKFVSFVRNMKPENIFDMNEVFPLQNEFNCYPGEFILLIGDTKLGKTALMQYISIMTKRMKIDYYSTEVSEQLIFRRFVQQVHNYDKKQVFAHYNVNDNSLSKGFEHIEIITAKPHLEDLKKQIAISKAHMIIFDTIDGIMTGKLGEYTSREEKMGFYMKDFAQSLNKIIIGVHHIPKSATVDYKGKKINLNMHSGKGSSALEQQADKILGFEGEADNEWRVFSSLGARDEAPFKIKLKYHKDTFRFTKVMDLVME